MKLLGHDIAPLGMGCWAIGGPFYAGEQSLGYANTDDATSTRTIHAAVDAGIRLFDTANVYGAGHSERLLGAALKDRPDALIVSKLGMAFDERTKQVLPDDTDPAHVEAAIDASLSRLQRDRIDIMLLHLNALSVELAAPMFDAMERARQRGKIRAYGWSTDFPASAEAMAGRDGFVGVEHAMNVFADVPTIQAVAERNDLVAFIRSPLAMGILTGKFDAASKIPRNDIRAKDPDWNDYFEDRRVSPHYLSDLAAIRDLLRSGGRTLSQGALGWLMAKSPRNLPIPGARTAEQVQDNAGAIELGPLPAEVMAEIETRIARDPEGEPRSR